jgi:hypothetical protein
LQLQRKYLFLPPENFDRTGEQKKTISTALIIVIAVSIVFLSGEVNDFDPEYLSSSII